MWTKLVNISMHASLELFLVSQIFKKLTLFSRVSSTNQGNHRITRDSDVEVYWRWERSNFVDFGWGSNLSISQKITKMLKGTNRNAARHTAQSGVHLSARVHRSPCPARETMRRRDKGSFRYNSPLTIFCLYVLHEFALVLICYDITQS